MNKEKVILSLVAVLVGLLVAGGSFYFYQQTKVIPSELQKPVAITTNQTPKPKVTLSLDEPKDESVSNTKVIKVSGKTDPDAVIVILTDSDYDVVTPTSTGDFSTTETIKNGENSIEVTAMNKKGDVNTIKRTVTYSTESF